MFDTLTNNLQVAFQRFGNHGAVTEKDLDTVLRDVRLALLEADVNFRVVKDFTNRVREKTTGTNILKSLTPTQQILDIVNREMVTILGTEASELNRAPQAPTIILMAGLQGSGKTTTTVKLASYLKGQGQKPLVVACDVYRPAAIEQLVTLAKQVDLPCYTEDSNQQPIEISLNSVDHARKIKATHVIIDTAGRLHIDTALMHEIKEIFSKVEPHEVLFVADSMSGQDAVNAAKEFHAHTNITGVVLTKVDGDARGGAALSIREVLGIPIKFVGTGETPNALEIFHPERIASRILGMGDMLSLIEKAKSSASEISPEKISEKLKQGTFDLQDFIEQLKQVKQMGSLSQIAQMLPGFKGLKANLSNSNLTESYFDHAEAIVLSMTPRERQHPELIDGKRRKRIAQGAGQTPAEVNRLLKQFFDARKIARQVMRGRMPSFGNFR